MELASPLLREGRARVSTMTSSAARTGKVNWDDLQSERSYAPIGAYRTSKLANLLFGMELDRRSTAGNWGIVSNVAHPGTTLTNLYTAGPDMGRQKPSPYKGIIARLAGWGLFVQNVDAGLLPALYAATAPEARGGELYVPDGLGHFTGGLQTDSLQACPGRSPRRADVGGLRTSGGGRLPTGLIHPAGARSVNPGRTRRLPGSRRDVLPGCRLPRTGQANSPGWRHRPCVRRR